MKFFNLDSPFMRALGKMADLMILNLLVLALCIPVVTAGAAFTAMHYVLLKMVREEDGYVTKDFFKSFRQNFGQATVIWIIMLLIGAILAADFMCLKYTTEGTFQTVIKSAMYLTAIIFGLVSMYVFPILSHFFNTTKKTFKNAFFMSILILPKSILMAILYALPFAVIYFITPLVAISFLFCFSAPGYAAAKMYNKTFKRFEPEDEEEIKDDFAWSVSANEDIEAGENNEDRSDLAACEEISTELSLDTESISDSSDNE